MCIWYKLQHSVSCCRLLSTCILCLKNETPLVHLWHIKTDLYNPYVSVSACLTFPLRTHSLPGHLLVRPATPPAVPSRWITLSVFTWSKSSRKPLIGAICNLEVTLVVCTCVGPSVCMGLWFVPAQSQRRDSMSVHDICSAQGQRSASNAFCML